MDDETWLRVEDEGIGYDARPIRNFEDLIAWQRARVVTREVYRLTRESRLRTDRALAEQMQRCAVSVMSNLAEGNERGSTPEYIRFVTIAKASCAELRSQLYVALDVGHLEEATFSRCMRDVVELGRIIGGLRASLLEALERERAGR